ncbi:MAG TPA: efflux transporter outer membrane subunit [Limnobacter sp.]|uniref:efflux transporter outer membrane subunit n=1 Tax=Limnobacter sp. TaxID=2003368 RepID=UPI002E35280A|nr:efflux transporter outer membrane subunit [Limnobacter sp.]HEX5485837.1 efflux transporter outer membrane subunit [Limnobacter sp.]
MNKLILASAVTLALSGCASQLQSLGLSKPVPQTLPAVQVPSDATAVGPNEVKDEQWWLLLNNPQLTAIIEQALKNNTDVRLAEQRLNEAGAQLGIAKSNKWPAIFGEFTKNRNKPTRAGNVPVFGANSVYEDNKLVLGASWELDLWGRISDLQDAAAAQFMAQGYNLSGVRLSVSTTAASLYTRVRVYGLLVKIAEETTESRKQALDLAQQRFNVGLTNELQLRQTESEYLAVKAQLPDLRQNYAQAQTALSILLGGNPPPIEPLQTDSLTLSKFVVVPEGTPSDLLLRRPDLAAAEQQLKAADANLAAARAAFFPTISLTGVAGRESADLKNLFTGPARIWSFTTDITQPIFQAGQLQSQRDVVLAQRNQAVINYEAAIRKAFGEVDDAITAQMQARDRLTTRAQQVQSLQRTVELAQKRVDAGVSGQLELLDAQRNLLNAQLDWAQAWGSQQSALLAMVSALGGGFKVLP